MSMATTYLGLPLKHPLIAAASPLSERIEGIRALEDGGAAAIVLHSLFREQISLRHMARATAPGSSHEEALEHFPGPASFPNTPERYLELIRRAKEATAIPIIASLNGAWLGDGWLDVARAMEQAGADALELNIYFVAADPALSGREVETMYESVLAAVCERVHIPVAVKIAPYFSALAHMAKRLERGGAAGLVLFNRFLQPEIDVERRAVVSRISLSDSHDLALPLRWIAILYGRLATDLALSGGVHGVEDVLKGLMAGATVVQLASELLQHGAVRLGELAHELEQWMTEHGVESVEALRGTLSQARVPTPAAYERAHYIRTLHSWEPTPPPARPAATRWEEFSL